MTVNLKLSIIILAIYLYIKILVVKKLHIEIIRIIKSEIMMCLEAKIVGKFNLKTFDMVWNFYIFLVQNKKSALSNRRFNQEQIANGLCFLNAPDAEPPESSQ